MNDRIDIMTAALKTAFVQGYHAIADPAPIEQCLTEVPSTANIERYPWLYPPPLMRQWQGFRRYATLGETTYRVENRTYTAEFEITKENYSDDQVGGYKLQAASLAEGAKVFPGIAVQQHLALGQTTGCFDGTNFFAASHTIGTGNNIVTGTASGGDAVTHAMAVLVVRNKMVKPLLWQRREGPFFRNNIGQFTADEVRSYKFISDMRGAPAFGFWWDGVLVKFSNTPTVADMQTTLGTVNARLRSFTYPKNQPDEPDQFIHGQTTFDDRSLVIVCSNLIEHIARQALTLSLIANTENAYKGFAKLIASGYLNDVT